MVSRRSEMLGRLLALALMVTSSQGVLGKLELIDGRLVDVVDECSRDVPDSCGPGRCCVTQYLGHAAVISEGSDPEPEVRQICQEFRPEGATCFTDPLVTELCPCSTGLVCEPGSFHFFGFCQSHKDEDQGGDTQKLNTEVETEEH